MGATDLGFHIWLTFRVLLIGLLAVYVLGGLDELIIDLLAGLRAIRRRVSKSPSIKPLTRAVLDSVPEQPIAIIIPAWDASRVIARMLLNTASTVLYKNYHIFVGVYPNDDATKIEVEKVREVFTHLEVVVTPAAGPTNKADGLNWVYQGILLFEKERHVQFAAYVIHNAGDVVHPLALKYYNCLIPRVHFVQLPVLPFEGPWREFTGGTYADEAAERQSRDTRVREVLGICIPAGLSGTALSREAMQQLAGRRQNQVFDIRAKHEDYLMGLLLRDLPGKKIFLQQSIERTVARPHPVTGRVRDVVLQEPVATRTACPQAFRAAVDQQAGWLRGLALQGGAGTAGLNYCLYRDRKAVLTSLLALGAIAAALYAGLAHLAGLRDPALATPPLLLRADPWFGVFHLALAMFAWRMLNRMAAVAAVYPGAQAILAVPRFFWRSLIHLYAIACAVGRAMRSGAGGRAAAWEKSSHAYPTEDQLLGFRRKLGDLLLNRRLITTAQLESAVARQKKTGQKLGEILVKMGALWEEDLVNTLAHQRNEHGVELDPHATPLELLERVSRKLAVQHRIYPLALKEGTLLLATDAQQRDALKPVLEAALNCPVDLQWTSSADIDFAINRGYRRTEAGRAAGPATGAADRLGERLVKEGLLSKEDLLRALRQQKRSDKKLGEVLLEMKMVSREQINEELAP